MRQGTQLGGDRPTELRSQGEDLMSPRKAPGLGEGCGLSEDGGSLGRWGLAGLQLAPGVAVGMAVWS